MRIIKCSSNKDGIRITYFIGGDLLKLDLGQWLSDVEQQKALAMYTPHEGGYEGRYLTRLRYQGYYFLDITARELGDPETTLTKVHPVCPAHLGRQPIAIGGPHQKLIIGLRHFPLMPKVLWSGSLKPRFYRSLSCNSSHCFPPFDPKSG